MLFLLNKTDLLETKEELAEVVKFVSKSANSLLGAAARGCEDGGVGGARRSAAAPVRGVAFLAMHGNVVVLN